MPIRRSNHLVARFEQAAQEKAAAIVHGRGRSTGHGCRCAPQVLAPAAGCRGGRAPTVEAGPCPVGQAPGEDEDEKEVDEEVDAEPARKQPHGGQNNRRQQAPPPPPNLVEVMAAQTQLLQHLTEVAEHRNNGGNRQGQPEEDLQRKIERFIHLKAPTFSYADDPMEADDWLRVIETKLDLTNCTDEECITLAVHQLEGPAKSWWDSYCDSHQDPAHITWYEFTRAFREQHVPRQVLIQKAQEFRTMT
jgi:hypothetical protein